MSRLRGCAAPRIAGLLAGLFAGMLAGACLAAPPIEVLRGCAARASPELSGIKRLGAECPGLEGALEGLGLPEILYDGWRERLNRDALRDLANLTDDYGGSRPKDAPDVAALPGILQTLTRAQTAQPSWRDAFKAWLRSWNWLDRWLDGINGSVTLTKLISYSLIALVLLAAAAVVVNEFKAAGAVRGARDGARAAARRAAAAAAAAVVPEPSTPADTLAALLGRLVERLMQTRRLDSERSLTHRELVARSVFDSDAQRTAFARVACSAESILYGPRSAAPPGLDAVLEEGRTLLAQLSAPAPAPAAEPR